MDIIAIVISLTILIFSAILHEIAHGFVADRMGDPTARILGRLTLNPKSHIDPYMTILVPLMMYIVSQGSFIFGGAKPVPVDPFNLREGRKDMALVALVGPITNVLIAIVAALLFHIVGNQLFLIGEILYIFIHINLLLAVFNLLPIPPLDGSKVFSLLLPEDSANAYLSLGSYGFFILIFLMTMPIGGFSLGALLGNLIEFSKGLLGIY